MSPFCLVLERQTPRKQRGESSAIAVGSSGRTRRREPPFAGGKFQIKSLDAETCFFAVIILLTVPLFSPPRPLSAPPCARSFSTFVAVCFTVNYIMGTGFLTIPWAFHSAGIVLSFIVLALVCLISDVSKSFVLEAMARASALYERKCIVDNDEDGSVDLVEAGSGRKEGYSSITNNNNSSSGSSSRTSTANSNPHKSSYSDGDGNGNGDAVFAQQTHLVQERKVGFVSF